MNILVLAAGYATRLYPLTLTKAKPLLDVAGKPMMEWVIDTLAPFSRSSCDSGGAMTLECASKEGRWQTSPFPIWRTTHEKEHQKHWHSAR